MEIGPSVVSMRGDSAKAKPASDAGEVASATPRPRASRTVPTNATHITSAIHSRWTTQAGTPSDDHRATKNGPIGQR